MTNNPDKVAALESAGITVAERVSAEVEPQETFAGVCADQAGEDGAHRGDDGQRRVILIWQKQKYQLLFMVRCATRSTRA